MSARLLIIDDEPDLVEALAMRFRVSGFEVETAADGRQGIERVRSFRPNVVLLDVAMPEMNGWDVCRALRADPATRELPVLVMTAAMLRGADEAARSVGADGVVRKPFDDRALVAAVKGLAARAAPSPQGPSQI
ncbi:MAG: response regulator [Elusimicrobia bacterium]|nr:response regulator [Elusimicrobiota bacterium]